MLSVPCLSKCGSRRTHFRTYWNIDKVAYSCVNWIRLGGFHPGGTSTNRGYRITDKYD